MKIPFRGHLLIVARNYSSVHPKPPLFENSLLLSPHRYRCFSLYNNEYHSDLKRFLLEFDADPKEGRYWLKYFKNLSNSLRPFAIAHVADDVFGDGELLHSLSSSLCFLQRNGMKCILLHGTEFDPTKQITLEEFKINKEAQIQNSLLLADHLGHNKTPCHLFFSGSGLLVSSSTKHPNNCENYQGHLDHINYDIVNWCLNSNHIPILGNIGESESGQLLIMDVSKILDMLSLAFQPLKILYLNSHGGLNDNKKFRHVIPQVNLPADLDTILQLPTIDSTLTRKVLNINQILTKLSPQSSIVITSADQVLKELFTHRGSGTLFKHVDTFIQTNNLEDIDRQRLTALINTTFEKNLKGGYFENIQNKIERMFVSENYTAAAIITNEEGLDINYLDKFVISSDIQGQGLSDTLWDLMKSQYKMLIWRSLITNKINPWYFKHSDGCWSNGRWIVFWYGISDPEKSHKAINHVLNIETSFLENSQPNLFANNNNNTFNTSSTHA